MSEWVFSIVLILFWTTMLICSMHVCVSWVNGGLQMSKPLL